MNTLVRPLSIEAELSRRFNKRIPKKGTITTVPRTYTKDGWSASIQASAHHMSKPADNYGPYETVEVAATSEPEPLLANWRMPGSTSAFDIYGFVPVSIVVQVLLKHGGLMA